MVNTKYIKRARAEFDVKDEILSIVNKINHKPILDDKDISHKWRVGIRLNNIANQIIDGKITACESGNFLASVIMTRPMIESIVRQFHISILNPNFIEYSAFCESFDIDKYIIDEETMNIGEKLQEKRKLQKKFSFRKIVEELYTGANYSFVNKAYSLYNKTIHADPRVYYGRNNEFEMQDIHAIPRVEPLLNFVLLNRLAEFQHYCNTPLQTVIVTKFKKYISDLISYHKKELIPMLPNKREIVQKLVIIDYLNDNDMKKLCSE